MISQDDIAEFFAQPARIATNSKLRDPQRLGHAAAVEHFAASDEQAIEQIAVGCGKTGLITLLPFGCAQGRVLVIAPNLTICDQLAAAFDVTKQTCAYTRFNVLDDVTNGPWVAVLNSAANHGDLGDAHVVVTNIHQLACGGGRWLNDLPADFFSLIIVDEGHHNAAPSWQDVFDRFPDARVISVTATPFRADDLPVEGEMVYAYPIAQAMREGYIKFIQASNVAPQKLMFSYRGDEREHELEEVLALRENAWFSRGVALAEACNVSIVDASIEWLKHLRKSGHHHQIIAAACSVDHARAIRHLYEERGWHAQEIHSGMPEEQQKAIKARLRDTRDLDVVVQVQMLGEGFDHPSLSVAAIFRPYRSLSPYIQFVGRIMRVNVQDAPGHPDNRGIVVSHVGLNIDGLWDDFKRIDEDDQRTVQTWLLSGEAHPATLADGVRRLLRPDMIVKGELTLDQFLGDTYLKVRDENLPGRVMEVLRAQGLDPSTVGLNQQMLELLRDTRPDDGPSAPVAQPVQPQARRMRMQRRLNEQERILAMRICQAVGLNPTGCKFAKRSGTGAPTDLQAAIVVVHRAVNKFLDIPAGARRELTTPELERVLPELDTIGDTVQAEIAKKVA